MKCYSSAAILVLLLVVMCAHESRGTWILPDNENFVYVGRVLSTSRATGVLMDWSGVQIQARFNGTSLTVVFRDQPGWQPPAGVNATSGDLYDIFIDEKQYVLQLQNHSYFYTIATGLSASQPHSLLIVKRTEPYVGASYFMGVSVDNNATLLPPPARLSRRIEFLGDSITCGYGNMGVPPCSFSPAQEENYLSYGPVTARALNAEYHLEAWSGIGLVRNYNDSKLVSDPNFPDFFNRTIADQTTNLWNFSSWIPDAVVVNLGTNDNAPHPFPNNTFWIESYGAFASYIRSSYGKETVIFAVCGPMISGQCCVNVQAAAKAYDLVYIDMQNILNPNTDVGCNGHPNVSGHAKMSAVALPIIQKTMNWS